MAKIIGIDLGTSNSAAAAIVAGRPTIIPSAEGTSVAGKAFPSYVAFTKDGQLLVGEPARRQAVSNPEGTVMAIKRKMGTDYRVNTFGKEYSPQQISAFILQKIKRDSESFLADKVEKAVITVPAYFNDNQRQATKDAGAIAGLEVVRIINEPTAASLAYGLDRPEKEMKIMVFDLGGGTLDVTLMEVAPSKDEAGKVTPVFTVLATSGDTQLGGTDMDNALIDYISEEFKKTNGIDLRNDKVAVQRVREAAEKAKIELSTVLTTDINLPFISADAAGPKHLTMTMTRAKLEELIRPTIDRCRAPLDRALTDSKLATNDVSKIILVGGPTRMPIVRKFVEDYMGKEAERGVDPMECVAMGAAIQAGVLAGEVHDLLLLDVTPLSLGVETLGNVFTRLVDRNTTIPTKRTQVFSTAADFQTTVTVHVLQGERPMAQDNVSLGMFNLTGIPPAPRGVPQIEVTFDIDANGILNVAAKDLATNKEQKITITASTKLSKEEIDKMVKQADQFASQDQKRKEEAEVRNNADNLIYSAERLSKELAAKLSKEQTEQINKAIVELRDAITGKEVAPIKQKLEALQKVMQDIGTAAYQQVAQQRSAAGGPAASSSPPPDQQQGEKPVDVDYKVVDDKK
ncbi:MAG TPA: molecular chaperone DnaK [Candidatus Acidoferrales bacterium]|nr:molecular chaperone DnaK [Candidatus Acidoferrales bacterium]